MFIFIIVWALIVNRSVLQHTIVIVRKNRHHISPENPQNIKFRLSASLAPPFTAHTILMPSLFKTTITNHCIKNTSTKKKHVNA
jgi:hypothetical protein